jgi:very-short-patch-repair endonuclease
MVKVARLFRKEPTGSERTLWSALRGGQVDGRKFRRQQPIGPFVVDFYCASERLIVEVDGGVHESQRERDAERQHLLETLGLRFVRVDAETVERDLNTAVEEIRAAFGHRDAAAVAVLPSPLVEEGPGVRGTPAAAPVSVTQHDVDSGTSTRAPFRGERLPSRAKALP